ncbi:MAG: aldo/keto reductase [Bacteroidales bacterium]|nr:aldo/keto reductase [Bacteroidales bacterium]
MIYNKIPGTPIKVSSITFGAWAIGGWMWGGADEKDALAALETSIDLGMTTIDTAPAYGFGKSEELVGKVIEGIRDKVQILTKYGLHWNTDKGVFYFKSEDAAGDPVDIHKYASCESVMKECEDSLRRLRTDYIDLYQIHWPDPSTPISETMEAVARLKEQGKIRAAGVCNYTVDLLKEANEFVDIVTNQVPYSMVKRDIEKDIVPYCQENGKGILPYSPLQRGILTGKITKNYTFNHGDHRPTTPYYKEPNLTRINNFLEDIKPIADENNLSLAQLVIYWTMKQPTMISTLVGARNPEQVKENIKAADAEVSDADLKEITRELDSLELDMTV